MDLQVPRYWDYHFTSAGLSAGHLPGGEIQRNPIMVCFESAMEIKSTLACHTCNGVCVENG